MSAKRLMIFRSGLTASLACAGLLHCPTPARADAAPDMGASASVSELPFSSFFRRPIGPRGLELSDALLQADGRQVRLVGYMVSQETPQAGRFLLAPQPVRLSEDADGAADDLPPGTVTVLLDAAQRERIVAHQSGLLALSGRLAVGRAEEADGRVSWVRLQLAPQALAAELPSSR
jgi:hypothetical protein